MPISASPFHSLASAAALAASLYLGRSIAGRAKFGGGERHASEESAGIILFIGHAFLIGHTVFTRIDQILSGTNDAHYRKDSDGNRQIASVAVAQRTVQIALYAVRNISATAAASAAGLLRIVNLAVQNQGIHHLYDADGHVLRGTAGLGERAIVRRIGIALEDAYVALSAVENDSLLHHGNSVKLLASSAAQASLKADFDIELDGNGVKAAIEFYGIDSDIGPGDAGVSCADIGGMLQQLVSVVGQNHLNVLKTVPITAGIQNAIGINANRFAHGIMIGSITAQSVIRHVYKSSSN